MNHKDWSSIVNLHYGNLRQREELREYLENCWINAREYHGNRGTSSEDAYWAMEELYQYLASQEGGNCSGSFFMMIMNFSMRHRKFLGRVDRDRNKKLRKTENLEGWRRVVKEWDRQANPSPKSTRDKETERKLRQDSLTELILNTPELRSRSEYFVGATIHMVRRLRKASDEDPNVLVYSNSLIRLAEQTLRDKEPGVENCLASPNEMLSVALRMQKWLNSARQSHGPAPPEFSSEALEKEIDEIREYRENLKLGQLAERKWANVYNWWFLRIKYRRALRRLDWKVAGAIREEIKQLRAEISAPTNEYIDSTKSSDRIGGLEGPYYKMYQYHLLLSNFIHYPLAKVASDRLSKKRRPTRSTAIDRISRDARTQLEIANWTERVVEERRYLEHVSFPRGTRLRKQNSHHFIDVSGRPPIELVDMDGNKIKTKHGKKSHAPEYSADWRESTTSDSLLRRCRNSITNSRLMAMNTIANRSHTAPAVLMLNAIDLLVKVRWFLAVPQIYYSNKTSKKSWSIKGPQGQTFKSLNEHRIATEIKESISEALRQIESGLSQWDCKELERIIDKCAEAFENLDFTEDNSKVSNLGRLCEISGAILGWEWVEPSKDMGRDKKMYDELEQLIQQERELTVQIPDSHKRIQRKGKKEEYHKILKEIRAKENEIQEMQKILFILDSETGKELIRINTDNRYFHPYFKPVGEGAIGPQSSD